MSAGSSFAQSSTADTAVHHQSSTFEKINAKMEWIVKWFPLPIISYNTETNWLFGLTKFNSFKLGKNINNDSLVPTSTITGLGYYTLNKQNKIVINSDLFFGRSGFRNYTQLIFVNFPSYYYGVGNDTKLKDQCLVTFKQKEFTDAFGYRFFGSVYISLVYRFKNYTKINYTYVEECNDIDTTLRNNEGIQSGLGIMLYDESRDNNINAHKGHFLMLAYVDYHQNLGSMFNFSYFLMDYRKYFPLAEKLTLATQFYSEINFGDVPVQSLALMGGAEKMRGVYLGRYRDKLMTVVQTEIRFPIYWILSGTAFAALGEVAPKMSGYTLDGIHWTAGLGLRLMVDSQHKANLRFDYGISSDQHFFFFGFGEAF